MRFFVVLDKKLRIDVSVRKCVLIIRNHAERERERVAVILLLGKSVEPKETGSDRMEICYMPITEKWHMC